MKKTVTTAVVAGVVCMASLARSAEVEAGADVATAYVFRGVTFNDGAVFQPYAAIGGLPVGIGVWGNLDLDDYGGALNKGQFSEIDLTLTYDLPLGIEALGATVGYTEYLYPGAEGDADREASLALALNVPLSPTLGMYYGLDGGIRKSLHAELGIEHGFALGGDATLTLGTAVGYEKPDEGDSGFSYYTASAALNYKILTAKIAYVGQIDDDALPDVSDDSAGYDVKTIGTIGLAYTF